MPVRRSGLDADPRAAATASVDDVGTAAINAQARRHHHPQHRVPLDDDQRRHRIPAPGKRAGSTPTRPGGARREHLPQAARRGAAAAPPRPAPTEAAIPGLPPGADGTPTAPPRPRRPSALPRRNTRITLTLGRIPLLDALNYVARQAGLKVKIEPYAVSIVPVSEQTDVMVTPDFRVPPNFISQLHRRRSAAARSARRRPRPTAGGGGTTDDTGTGTAR